MNKTILLASRPKGLPKLTDFKMVSEATPAPKDGELLLKAVYASVDPYLRGRMNDTKSYIPPFELLKPIESGMVAEVITSKHKNFNKGDFVSGILPWKELQVSSGEGFIRVDPAKAPLSSYLGVLGMTGLTAYLGLTEIGKPKKGETLVVSVAAGAVGSVVGQIGKILGLRVVGIVGTDQKTALLKDEFGFDEAINYKKSTNMVKSLSDACPKGIDIYFDNVGGPVSDAVFFHINTYARLVICGAIALYNESTLPKSLSVQPFLIRKRALMQGFIVFDYTSKYPEAISKLAEWYQQGQIRSVETIRDGFHSLPQAFIDLFDGKNQGKMLVKI